MASVGSARVNVNTDKFVLIAVILLWLASILFSLSALFELFFSKLCIRDLWMVLTILS